MGAAESVVSAFAFAFVLAAADGGVGLAAGEMDLGTLDLGTLDLGTLDLGTLDLGTVG